MIQKSTSALVRLTRRNIPLLVGACLFAVGCSGSDDSETETPYDPNATPTEMQATEPQETDPPGTPTQTPVDTGLSGSCDSGRILQVTATAITADTTWDCTVAPYVLTADVSVENDATLTIGPGATLQFGSDVSLMVGSQGGGSIVADGREDPILFTTNKPIGTAGDWSGIIVDALAAHAEFRNVTFEYGGDYSTDGSEAGEALLQIYRASAIVTDSTFQNSSSNGIYMSTGGTVSEFDGNTFLTNLGSPISVEAGSVTSLTGQHTFDTNDQVLVAGGTLTESATWVDIGAPYAVDGTLAVGGDANPVLTIGPGVSLLFEEEAKLLVGQVEPGGIYADGADGAITFASSARVPLPGDWEGIVLDQNTSEAYFRNVSIRHGGNYCTDSSVAVNAGLAVIGAEVRLSRSTIESNDIYGMQLLNGATLTEFSENNFALSDQAAIFTGPDEVGSLAGTNTFEDDDFIEVSGGAVTKSATWANVGAPYKILDTIEVASLDEPVLTIAEDTTLLFEADVALVVGKEAPGGLVADGSAGAVTFTSGVVPPASGDWEGIILDAQTTEATLREVTVEYAGNYSSSGSNPGEAAIRLIESSAIVTDCTFRENLVYDIDFADGAGSSEFFRNSFQSLEAVPMIVDATSAGDLGQPNEFEVGRLVHVRGGTITESASWSALGAPYFLLDYVHVGGADSPVLTINDEVTIQFDNNVGITVGSVGPGAMIANGKGGDITFTASGVERDRLPGDWQAVTFDSQTDEDVSLLDSVIFEFCGDYHTEASEDIEACLGVIDVDLAVDQCTFRDSAGAGIELVGTASIVGSGNSFSDNANGDYELPGDD